MKKKKGVQLISGVLRHCGVELLREIRDGFKFSFHTTFLILAMKIVENSLKSLATS